MSKYCEKCGREIAEDDFLCPYCGAIWGDRIYRVTQEASHPDEVEEEAVEQDGREETPVDQDTPAQKNRFWRNLWMLGAAVLSVILFVILIGPKDQEDEPTKSTTPATSTVDLSTTPTLHPPIVTNPTVITIERFTVQVVDQYGHGIAGVKIKNENSFTSVMISVTDSEGIATLMAFPGEAYVCILDVPEGYSRAQIGIEYPFVGDSNSIVIVVQKDHVDE